ncbi:MAG: hypothetical protein B7Z06_08895, partial [Flavobacteriales bacterium 32-35-8]
QNKIRKIKRDEWINLKVKKWRRNSWIEFIASILVFSIVILSILYYYNWSISEASKYIIQLKSNIIISGIFSLAIFIFSAITLNTLVGKYRNHSNIQNYIKGLEIPEEYLELKNDK